jgi:spermidine synthase
MRGRLVVAFTLSGFAGLVYETAWTRLLLLSFGATTEALATVVAAFMGGLALGSGLGGRWADRQTPRACLRGYVLAEVGIALLCVISLPLMGGFAETFALLERVLPGGGRAARLLVAGGVLLPPTMLMGATLPVLVRSVLRQPERLAPTVARLYSANTLGAVAGALATGFLLLPGLGITGTVHLAAACNLLAALLAYSVARLTTGDLPRPTAPVARATTPVSGAALLLLGSAAFSGAGALGLEVLWARGLLLVTGSSSQAVALMLATYLGGVAAGSAAYGRLAERIRAPALWAGGSQMLVAVSSILLLRLMVVLPFTYLWLWGPLHSSPIGLLALRVLPAVLLMLVPTFIMGASLPALIQAYSGDPQTSGRDLGAVYAANTLGGVVGSLLVGLVVLPELGVGLATQVAALVYFAGAVAAVCAAGVAGSRRAGYWLLAPATLIIALVQVPRWDPIVMGSGLGYLSQRWDKLRTEGRLDEALGRFKVLYYRDGREASILVYRSADQRAFVVNGRHEATTNPDDARNQYMLGHLPALLHQGPVRDALVIALGSGMTAGCLAQHADRVTVVELSPEVAGAAAFFSDWNHGLLEDPRISLRIDDGRHFLLTTEASYDVITVDPIHPSVAGSDALYSREHYALVKQRLRPGGIAAQWLPLYQMPVPIARTIAGTFLAVFPDAQLWLVGPDAILIGGGARLPAAMEIQAELQRPEIGSSLRRVRMQHLSTLLALSSLGPPRYARYVGDAPVSTDDRPRIEFDLPWHAYDDTIAPNLMAVLQNGARPAPISLEGLEAGDLQAVERAREGGVLTRAAIAFQAADQLDLAGRLFLEARKLDPDGPLALQGLR